MMSKGRMPAALATAALLALAGCSDALADDIMSALPAGEVQAVQSVQAADDEGSIEIG